MRTEAVIRRKTDNTVAKIKKGTHIHEMIVAKIKKGTQYAWNDRQRNTYTWNDSGKKKKGTHIHEMIVAKRKKNTLCMKW